MPRDPVAAHVGSDSKSRLRYPDAPDEPESSTDPRIDRSLTEDLSILQGLLSGLPMSL